MTYDNDDLDAERELARLARTRLRPDPDAPRAISPGGCWRTWDRARFLRKPTSAERIHEPPTGVAKPENVLLVPSRTGDRLHYRHYLGHAA